MNARALMRAAQDAPDRPPGLLPLALDKETRAAVDWMRRQPPRVTSTGLIRQAIWEKAERMGYKINKEQK